MLRAGEAARRGEDPVAEAIRQTRGAWLHVGVFSALVNLLMLSGSIYMMQVYDRVLASHSVPTLVVISLIVLVAFLLQGFLDSMRMRMLVRIAALFDSRIFPYAARATLRMPIRGANHAATMQPMRDSESVRSFLGSLGPTALLDMPFLPLFLVLTFLLHPWLGILATASGLIIIGLTLVMEARNARLSASLMQHAGQQAMMLEAGRRNAEAIAAMGMERAHLDRLSREHQRQLATVTAMADVAGGIGSMAKTFRMVLQSTILGLGAYLAIRGEISAGSMIAASILIGRALAPVELAVAHWRGFVSARQALRRLRGTLPEFVDHPRGVELPRPERQLTVRNLAVCAPTSNRILVQNVSMELSAGQALAIIGPSGAGKSSLVRALAGVWPIARGEIRLDGALLDQWDPAVVGRFIGYLPQDVELFDGTIAENIARLDPARTSEAVIRSATAAGAHELILSLPQGYDTPIGEGGAALSAGQRQRIGLARALYGDPFLLLLDEPNSHLDGEGDKALGTAIRATRARGGIVIVITHRPVGLAEVDFVAVIADGRVRSTGTREEMLPQILPRSHSAIVDRSARRQPSPPNAASPKRATG